MNRYKNVGTHYPLIMKITKLNIIYLHCIIYFKIYFQPSFQFMSLINLFFFYHKIIIYFDKALGIFYSTSMKCVNILSKHPVIILLTFADHEYWLCPTLLVIFLALAPVWCWVSHHNKYVHDVLYEGWTPVIVAMLISRQSVATVSWFRVSIVKSYKSKMQDIICTLGFHVIGTSQEEICTFVFQQRISVGLDKVKLERII